MPVICLVADRALLVAIPTTSGTGSEVTPFAAVTHALEAYVSVMASDYTDPQALQALKLLKRWLPEAYLEGTARAREQVHSAATLAIPDSIRAAGVDEAAFMAHLDGMAEQAFDDQCTGANPRFPLISELRGILLDSWHGRATRMETDLGCVGGKKSE